MADGSFGSGVWAFVAIGGFIILGIAIAWAKLRNKTTPAQDRHTEAATRRMYDEQNKADRGNTP